MEIKMNNEDFKYDLVIGVIRKKAGEPPEMVLRWDDEKILERLVSKVSEKYFAKGVFKKPANVKKFTEHLREAWADLSGELIGETENTKGI